MIQFKALLIKELKEALRDRRALAIAFMAAFLAPVAIFAMSKMAVKEAVETPPVYAIINGVEFAPKLITQLEKENIFAIDKVKEGERRQWTDRNIILTIPDDFGKNMAAGKPIDITLRADYSEQANGSSLRRIRYAIEDYGWNIANNRLLVRGIDNRLLKVVNLIEQDTGTPASNAIFITMMLGLYLLMAAFLSGLSAAIDSSAGERERNVLELLLCQPINAMKIVSAKLCCASFIAIFGVVLTLGLTTFSLGFVDLSQIGASFSLDLTTWLALLALLIPICMFASALQLLIAFNSKSFKEAQAGVTMVVMIPVMIPAILSFIENKAPWLDWLPIVGQSLLMEEIFKGLAIDWVLVGLTGILTLAITAILMKVTAIKLTSEKVVLALG